MSTSKICSLSEAIGPVWDGMEIATGGWIFNSQPMALVRQLLRSRIKNLRLTPAPGSIAPDMLIGAGVVASTACVFISFEQFGLAPNFRRAAETGEVEVREMDGPAIAGGLRAGACDLPYMLVPDMATDLPKVNPAGYRPVESKPGERRMLSVPAVQPDLVLLHGQQADALGNVQFFGGAFFDPLLAQAGKRVVVSVDRIVDTDTIRKSNRLTKLPSAFVDAVVELPFGAHPCSSSPLYNMDEPHIREYVKASTDQSSFSRYLESYVYSPATHDAYLDAVGRDHLAEMTGAMSLPAE
ncbi:CoA transferase subunit A [Ferrovibrio xuzhouensis]|uniref:CoA transferase subunit A n=1 Tax=Ferrovibrio xuzhouensis TaxID=1576914 RepID=A0ABV7VCJ5_9PROT